MTKDGRRRGECHWPVSMLAAAVAFLPAPPVMAVPPLGDPGAVAFCPAGPDPFEVRLVPTAHANGAAGTVRLTFAESPFVVAVTREGRHHYNATVTTTGLDARGSTMIVWATTPELDSVQKLGVLEADGTLGPVEITFNKFLVFVTAEPSADVERWSGDILLRGISPSGRMHTMAGHGPFQGESCGGMFGPRW